ncbi:MAG TPA: MraY family glycosyltransferase [Phycisphaerae bacterium]|nr:MraY family glycosyltransferase [Phycisphaerae bacterium]HPS52895.1 MraY family glycosyltransferase [Phycisphaerae bacterium]
MLTVGIISAVVAFVISAALTPLCRFVASRGGLLDKPSAVGHKGHEKAVPLLGGAAIFWAIFLPTLAVVAACGVFERTGAPSFLPRYIAVHIHGVVVKTPHVLVIFAAALLLHVVGIIDDRRALGAWPKLAVQFIAATAVVIYGDVRVLTLAGPWVSVPLTIVWIVVITNSFNFLDNMDGLSVGIGAIVAAALALAAWGMGQWFVAAWVCIFFGAFLGFLPYNFAPASVFMGDAGSLVTGFLLAVASCLTTYIVPSSHGGCSAAVAVPLLLMAVPLYDTFSVMYIRLSEGRNPMVGDRRHFSHRLVSRGMSTRSAVLTIYLCAVSTALAGSILPHTRGILPAIMLVSQTICTLLILAMLESRSK